MIERGGPSTQHSGRFTDRPYGIPDSVLTFDWHAPYLHLLAKTGCSFVVGDWVERADGRGWNQQQRPLPPNLRLEPDPAAVRRALAAGEYDLAIAQTPQDVDFLDPFDVPAIYLSHNALLTETGLDATWAAALQARVGAWLAGRGGLFVTISPRKLATWRLDGVVVEPGIDLTEYGGYAGDVPAALRVGTLFAERDFMLGYSIQQRVLAGLPAITLGLNPSIPGARPAKSWDELRAYYRRCRLLLSTCREPHEDGYNLVTLEALATGMPVVALDNATVPLADGVDGFVAADEPALRRRVEQLLADRELARAIGAAGRERVAARFPIDRFVESWQAAFAAARERWAGRRNRQV